MKEILTRLPIRTNKPRENGLTMVMDKGLSLRQAEDFLSSSHDHTDIIKLGFGTSIITTNVADKIKLYQDNGILVYTGGTLFEAFAIRNQLEDYKKYITNIGINMIEISDGSINLDHDEKCKLITNFSKEFQVISEVGSKDPTIKINSRNWIKWIQNELSAGSWKVITEAREGGNIGICNDDGSIKSKLINHITEEIDPKNIIWEAPQKNQQVWFLNKFGANVNLGNIAPDELISLESLRLGLRGDTFNYFINK